jgi:hypothetical protein
MNKIHPESIIYLKNINTRNRLIKIQIYEKSTKVSIVKKYFGKYHKESFPKYFNYKVDIYNDYDIRRLLLDYDLYVLIAKPKFIGRRLKIIEKGIAVTFLIGVIVIIILI